MPQYCTTNIMYESPNAETSRRIKREVFLLGDVTRFNSYGQPVSLYDEQEGGGRASLDFEFREEIAFEALPLAEFVTNHTVTRTTNNPRPLPNYDLAQQGRYLMGVDSVPQAGRFSEQAYVSEVNE